MSSKLDYRIRQYRPSDLPPIRALLYEGFVTSKGSVADVGVRRALTQPPCIIGYAHILSGAALFLASRSHTLIPLLQRIPFSQTTQSRLGIALSVVGATLIFAIRGAISAEIPRRRAHEGGYAGHREWYCKPGGGFWVAVRKRQAIGNGIGSVKAGEEQDEEVLGYVGREYQPTSPPFALRDPATPAEIRRMIVAEAHRRKGLANALTHPAAQMLYERLGFVTIRGEVIGNWAGTTVLREYRRRVVALEDRQVS